MKKYLIDTHILIWFLEDNEKLPKSISNIMINESEKIHVSTISLWEISIKRNIGKLKLNLDSLEIFDKCQTYWTVKNDITAHELNLYESLPLYHRDPFDRMLIAQARIDNMIIITKDSNFKKYDVNILWEK